MGAFKEPHGGELKELYLPEGKADEEKLLAWGPMVAGAAAKVSRHLGWLPDRR